MQIKVEHTKTISTDNIVGSGPTSLIVAEGKLVLVGCEPTESLLAKYNSIGGISYSNGKATLAGTYYKPIILSKTEKIEVGDWFIANQAIHKCVRIDEGVTCPYITINEKGSEIGHFHTWKTKILALPEHFSPQQLQMIVDGKLKDGDKVLVECFHGVSLDFQESKSIKLNSSNHITLHKVEEKMYTREELKKIIIAYQYSHHHSGIDAEEWFEQNVK